MSSSATTWKTAFGSVSSGGNRYFGRALAMSLRANSGSLRRSRTSSCSCNGMGTTSQSSAASYAERRRGIIRNG